VKTLIVKLNQKLHTK